MAKKLHVPEGPCVLAFLPGQSLYIQQLSLQQLFINLPKENYIQLLPAQQMQDCLEGKSIKKDHTFYMKFGVSSPKVGRTFDKLDFIPWPKKNKHQNQPWQCSSRSASPGRNVGSFIPRCSLSNQVLSAMRWIQSEG